MRSAHRSLVFFFLFLLPGATLSGQNPPASDPKAAAMAAQSIAALTGENSITDVTLSGTGTWTVAADSQTGPITFKALGTGESRLDMTVTSGPMSEIRDASTGVNRGQWVDGTASNLFALHNCWTDAAWFFPALSSLSLTSNPNVVFSYVGLESWQGISVQHIRSSVYVPGQDPGTTAFIQSLSTIDFYLDASSYLPVAVAFNTHPDDDATSSIPIQINFSNYQAVSGLQVPLHVQKIENGQLVLDVTFTSVVLNSGLQLSTFSLQ